MAGSDNPLKSLSDNLLSDHCWDDYCMALAVEEGENSKDENTKVGACISNNQTKTILGKGCNNMPEKCDKSPWTRTAEKELDTKYPYVCHAAMDAIMNCIGQHSLQGSTMYIKMLPCNECAKLILKAGITRVVYICEKAKTYENIQAAKALFDMAGVRYEKIRTKNQSLQETFNEFKKPGPQEENRRMLSTEN